MTADENALRRRLSAVERELDGIRGREFEHAPGTAKRARLSRKCDYLAMERNELRTKLDELEARL